MFLIKPYLASHLKDMNRQTVYNLIARLSVTSKAEISRKTNISRPTTIKIVNFLIDAGLVLELGEGESAVGRKPQMLTLNRECMYSASFFFEGEFLSFGIVDIAGDVVYKKTLRCEPHFDYIMERIAGGLAEEMFADAHISIDKMIGMGIALPVIYDSSSQKIVAAPLIGIYQPRDITHKLKALNEKYRVPVIVENDANAQCLGEFRLSGMGEGDDLVTLSIGTGIGAGIIIDGKLRRGANNMCGEIGYFSFGDSGDNSVRAENIISHRAIEKRFGISVETELSALPPQMAELILEYISSPLVTCINNVAMLLDCVNLRIGGIVVNMFGDALIDMINDKLGRLCINGVCVQKQTNEDIGLVGVADSLIQNKICRILTGKDIFHPE